MKSSAALAGVSAFAAAASALQFQNTPLYSSYSFNALEHLAGNSPYFEPVDNPGRQPDPPRGCSVTRAAYLVRHAAINANDFDYEEYLEPSDGITVVEWPERAGSMLPETYLLVTLVAGLAAFRRGVARFGAFGG